MFGLGISVILMGTILLALVQITIFRSAFPKGLRNFFAYYPFLGVLVNFLLSGVILVFTGVGNVIGFLNLCGSVVFGIYLVAYRNFRQLEKPEVKWRLGVVPTLRIREGNSEDHWLM